MEAIRKAVGQFLQMRVRHLLDLGKEFDVQRVQLGLRQIGQLDAGRVRQEAGQPRELR